MRKIVLAGALSLGFVSAAHAQALNFDQAAYVTCKEAQAMNPEARKALGTYLAEHASRYRGVAIPDGALGTHLALLVRGGCTLAPDAYLFTVIDRALQAEKDKLPKR